MERELRVTARNPKTYYLRLTTALFAALCGIALIWLAQAVQGIGISFSIFEAISILAFSTAAVRGAIRTADAISEEKRDQPLEPVMHF